jgi:hypothetical protein
MSGKELDEQDDRLYTEAVKKIRTGLYGTDPMIDSPDDDRLRKNFT